MTQPGPGSREGLGTRDVVPAGPGCVETTLNIDAALTTVGGFVEAVIAQRDALAQLDHPQLASVTAVRSHRDGGRPTCAVVCAHAAGESLDHLLGRFESAGLPLSTAAVLYIVRELLAVLRTIHAHGATRFHGAITADAVVITHDQRVVLRDQVFGRALAASSLPVGTWWCEHQVAVPTAAGIPPFTPLTDQVQVGVLALRMLLGRRLGRDEYPGRLDALLDTTTETSIDGDEQPMGNALRAWVERTLLLSPDGPFRSLTAASEGLDELLDAEADYVAAPIGLDAVEELVCADAHPEPAAAAHASPDSEPPVGMPGSYDPFTMQAPRIASLEPGDAEGTDAACHSRDGCAFIVESNDGTAAPLSFGGSSYEPIFVADIGGAGEAGASSSMYDAAPGAAEIETNLVAPPVDAPRPFWDLPGGHASTTRAAIPPVEVNAELAEQPRVPPIPLVSPTKRTSDEPLAIGSASPDGQEDLPEPSRLTDLPPRTHLPVTASRDLHAAVADFEDQLPPGHEATASPAVRPVIPAPASPTPGIREPQHADSHRVPIGTSALGAPVRRVEVRNTTARTILPHRTPGARGCFDGSSTTGTRQRWMILGAALAIVMGGALAVAFLYLWPTQPAGAVAAASAEPGGMRLESKPAGALVRVNGIAKGTTPVTLAVPPGAYRLEFERGAESRSISVVVTSNNETYQSVMIYPPGPPGQAQVNSVPAGAAVSINGQPHGKTPVRVEGLAPGEYTVVVENAVARSERKVEILPDQVAAVDIPLSGLVAITSPIPLRIQDGDRPLGDLRNGRIAVGAGVKRLQISNYDLGFDEAREIDVAAGEVTPLVVTPPDGVLNLTADTTTDVYLDGRPIGLTPLTNLTVALGTHEVTFRHARFGEQNYTVLVGLTTPNRLHVTMQPKGSPAQRRAPAPTRRRP